MANIYDIRRYGKAAFLVVSIIVVALFLYYSNSMVADLAEQERQRMEIWADATKEIVNMGSPDTGDAEMAFTSNVDFVLSIIERNTTIPVLLTDDEGNILQHRNFNLPESIDSANMMTLSPVNEAYLKERLEALRTSPNSIDIAISPGLSQHLYYEDSTTLRRLSYFPYVLLAVMLVFVMVVYFAVLSTKKAEQNKVWVGLSKETAHQLGTPISSLMAWLELLRSTGVDAEMVNEMDKDVNRLSTIASRFSKVGSRPSLTPGDLNEVAMKSVEYMKSRISGRIRLTFSTDAGELPVDISSHLFEWVMENLIKNAVDAMDSGQGAIEVSTAAENGRAVIEVADTGRGMSRKAVKNIFNPGFTTKTRGWGLGLTLAKRIVEEYHRGKIFVKSSAPGQGTIFRIEIPLAVPESPEKKAD